MGAGPAPQNGLPLISALIYPLGFPNFFRVSLTHFGIFHVSPFDLITYYFFLFFVYLLINKMYSLFYIHEKPLVSKIIFLFLAKYAIPPRTIDGEPLP